MADQPIVPANSLPLAPGAQIASKDAKVITPAPVETYEIDGVKYNKADLKKQLDLAKGGQKALQDADRARKDASNLIAALKQDPAGTLNQLVKQGIYTLDEAKAVAKTLYAKQIYEPSTKSKEQLEMEQIKAERAELLAEKTAREKAQSEQTAKVQALQSKKAVTEKLSAAFKANAGVPETADTIRFAAKHWKIAKDNGTPISYEEAVKRGWNEIKEVSKRIGTSYSGDDIIDYYGEEVADKINKAWLKRLNAKQAAKEAKKEEKSNVVPNEAPKREDKGLSRRERQQAAIKDAVNKITNGGSGR